MQLLFVFILVSPLVIGSSGDSQAADKPSADVSQSKINDYVEAILNSKYPYETDLGPGMANGFRSLFRLVGAKRIWELQLHQDDGIAIQAAWEAVELTVPEEESSPTQNPDGKQLLWFLGFLEGRARVKAPSWWSEVVLESQASKRHEIYPGNPKSAIYHHLGVDQVQGPKNVSLRRDAKEVLLRIDEEVVSLPEEIFAKNSEGALACSVSAAMTPSRCYIAVHDPFQAYLCRPQVWKR